MSYFDNVITGKVFAKHNHAKATDFQGDEFISIDESASGNKVAITFDANYKPWVVETEGNSGNLTDDELAELTISEVAKIINGDEYYEKSDVTDSYIVFVHTGRDNQQQIFSKAIYVYTDSSTVQYKTWLKVSSKVAIAPNNLPISDGTYTYKLTKNGSNYTYSWVLDS